MQFIILVVFFLQIYIFQCQSEWVKISQNSDEYKITSKVPKIETSHKSKDLVLSAPSPEWIEYQRERFGGSNISQKLVISGESHLKTSAEIIVPAQINKPEIKRNKILRTKTKISLEDLSSIENTQQTTEEPSNKYNVPKKPKPNKSGANFDGSIKFPSFKGFLKFLTSLQKSLLTKNSFGIMDKIKMLKNIRDHLMFEIEQRFVSMFPKSRQKRGLTDESNFLFPPETALMSINFLTFSVFLIKLVLQVIHIIKSKHFAYSGMIMNNTTSKSGINARKFGESQEDFEIMKKVSNAIKANPFR